MTGKVRIGTRTAMAKAFAIAGKGDLGLDSSSDLEIGVVGGEGSDLDNDNGDEVEGEEEGGVLNVTRSVASMKRASEGTTGFSWER